MFSLRVVVCAVICLPCLLHATVQREGNTNQVKVPVVAEPWSTTANQAAETHNRIIPAPQSQEQILHSATATVPANAQAQGLSSQESLVAAVFPGPANGLPPDSQIAAGPDHLVAVVNSVISLYSKNGTVLSTAGLSSFFQSLPGANCGCFDSRILYDQNDGRFIMSTSMRFGSHAAILLAVSQTSDPTGNWFKYEINQSDTSWWDFPILGLSSSAIYIAADEIATSAHIVLTIVGIPELLVGNSTLNITRFDNVSVFGGPTPAITFGSSANEYLLQSDIAGSTLHLLQINTSGAPTLTRRDITVETYSIPPGFAPQPGQVPNSGLVNSATDIHSLVWRNGSLWATQTVLGPNNNAVERWYQIDPVAATVTQMGTLAGAGNTGFSAITVLPDNSVDMVFTTSSPTQFASAAYAHRSPTDPPGSMSVSGIYQAGTATYRVNRWGDYSGISPDPSGNGSWGIAELAGNSFAVTTSIVHIANASTPGDFNLTAAPNSISISPGQTATYSLSVTPQNGFQSAVTFSCSGLPPGATCTFNPASVTPNGAPASVQASISTAGPNAQALPASHFRIAALVVLALPVAGLLRLGSRRSKRLKPFATMFLLLLLLVITGMQLGCGGVANTGSSLGPA